VHVQGDQAPEVKQVMPMLKRDFLLITQQAVWETIAEKLLHTSAIALDIENNGYFRYPDRICLIQIGHKDCVYLLDPLAISNLKSLGRILANPRIEKVFHSCENDLRALDRDFGFRVKNIFDTAVAAHFLGSERLGLSSVLQEFLNIELPKSKTLQRQDWTHRPLDQRSLTYAAGDVAYLLELKDELITRLKQSNRLTWVLEEGVLLEKIKADAPTPAEDLFWSVKGNCRLNDKQRAVLQQLTIFRDALCRELDRAPFRVMRDEVLLTLAQNPDTDFKNVKGLSVIFQVRRQSALRRLLKQAKRIHPIPLRKTNGRKPSAEKDENRQSLFNALKCWRKSKGKELELDPSLLWPMSSLERLANHQTILKAGSEVRKWQKKEFAKEIEKILNEYKNRRNEGIG